VSLGSLFRKYAYRGGLMGEGGFHEDNAARGRLCTAIEGERSQGRLERRGCIYRGGSRDRDRFLVRLLTGAT
jgi:hypothetical protein